MAAQAVDFTISGHVNRALFITDADDSTTGTIANNGEWSSRFRFTGSNEVGEGQDVSIHFEYEESGTSVNLRQANVQYGGAFGRITIGQASEAGDGSAYPAVSTGVYGLAHGSGGAPAGYFGSLDAGGRTHLIRYDAPAIGPVGAAVSVANGDSVSAMATLRTEFGGTDFSAELGTLQSPGDQSTVSASFGVSLPAGLIVAGAWGQGNDHMMGAKDAVSVNVDNSEYGAFWNRADTDGDGDTSDEEAAAALMPYGGSLEGLLTGPTRNQAIRGCGAMGATGSCLEVVHTPAVAANVVDPSYFQLEVGYQFGNTAVGASWYQSQDMTSTGSEGTAIGIGATHSLPKAGATVYAAVQNYEAEDANDVSMVDSTVFTLGTVVTF